MRISSVLVAVLVTTALIVSSGAISSIPSPAIAGQPAGGQRFGFWVDEGNLWSGAACGNTPSSYYTPTGFIDNYFLTSPYPAAMLWSTDLAPTGPCSPGVSGEISLLTGIASLADSYPNIRIMVLYFVNQNGPWDDQGTVINQATLTNFNSLLSGLRGDSSIEGIQPEFEYLVDQNGNSCGQDCVTDALISAFNADVESYGFQPIAYDSSAASLSPLSLDYSGYPYENGVIPTSLAATNSIGIGYGLTGAPSTGPIWTQTVIDNIVNTSPGNGLVLAYCQQDTNNPAGGQLGNPLWMSPTLRGWVSSASGYSYYLTANGQAPPTSSTTTTATVSTSTSTSTTTTSKTTATSSTTTTSTISSASASTSTSSPSTPYPYVYVQSSLGFVLGTNVSVTSLSVDKSAQDVTFTASHVSWEFLMPQGYTLIHILDNGADVTTNAQVSTNSTGTLYQMKGSSSWEIDYSQTGGTTTATSTTSTATATSTSGTTATSTSSTSTSTTLTWSTVTSSTSPTSQTSSQTTHATTTKADSQDYTLSVLGGCPSMGSGTYSPGSTAVVQIEGACDRNGNSGLRVKSWSLDGGANTTVLTNSTFTLLIPMNAPHTIAFYTVKQYSLSLDYGAQNTLLSLTSPQIPGDNYWYDSGTVVTFVGAVKFQGYTAAGWELDGGSPNLISGVPDLTTSFVMTGPHALTVLLVQSNNSCATNSCSSTPGSFVTIQTDASVPSGVWVDGAYYPKSVTFDWQDGTIHNVTAAIGVRQSSVRTQFAGWEGLSGSQSRTVILNANASGRLTADYSKQYLVTLAFTDANHGPLSPQTVTLRGPSGTEMLSANLSVWADPGASYTITSAVWMDWNAVMSNDSSFKVTQASALSFLLGVYPQTIKVTDAYNLPLQGALVNVTTLDGAKLSIVTDAQGIALFRVPVGLFSATVNYMGVSDQVVSQSEGSHSYAVSFLLSYPLLATVGTVSAVVGVFAFFRLRRLQAKGIYNFSDTN